MFKKKELRKSHLKSNFIPQLPLLQQWLFVYYTVGALELPIAQRKTERHRTHPPSAIRDTGLPRPCRDRDMEAALALNETEELVRQLEALETTMPVRESRVGGCGWSGWVGRGRERSLTSVCNSR